MSDFDIEAERLVSWSTQASFHTCCANGCVKQEQSVAQAIPGVPSNVNGVMKTQNSRYTNDFEERENSLKSEYATALIEQETRLRTEHETVLEETRLQIRRDAGAMMERMAENQLAISDQRVTQLKEHYEAEIERRLEARSAELADDAQQVAKQHAIEVENLQRKLTSAETEGGQLKVQVAQLETSLKCAEGLEVPRLKKEPSESQITAMSRDNEIFSVEAEFGKANEADEDVQHKSERNELQIEDSSLCMHQAETKCSKLEHESDEQAEHLVSMGTEVADVRESNKAVLEPELAMDASQQEHTKIVAELESEVVRLREELILHKMEVDRFADVLGDYDYDTGDTVPSLAVNFLETRERQLAEETKLVEKLSEQLSAQQKELKKLRRQKTLDEKEALVYKAHNDTLRQQNAANHEHLRSKELTALAIMEMWKSGIITFDDAVSVHYYEMVDQNEKLATDLIISQRMADEAYRKLWTITSENDDLAVKLVKSETRILEQEQEFDKRDAANAGSIMVLTTQLETSRRELIRQEDDKQTFNCTIANLKFDIDRIRALDEEQRNDDHVQHLQKVIDDEKETIVKLQAEVKEALDKVHFADLIAQADKNEWEHDKKAFGRLEASRDSLMEEKRALTAELSSLKARQTLMMDLKDQEIQALQSRVEYADWQFDVADTDLNGEDEASSSLAGQAAALVQAAVETEAALRKEIKDLTHANQRLQLNHGREMDGVDVEIHSLRDKVDRMTQIYDDEIHWKTAEFRELNAQIEELRSELQRVREEHANGGVSNMDETYWGGEAPSGDPTSDTAEPEQGELSLSPAEDGHTNRETGSGCTEDTELLLPETPSSRSMSTVYQDALDTGSPTQAIDEHAQTEQEEERAAEQLSPVKPGTSGTSTPHIKDVVVEDEELGL